MAVTEVSVPSHPTVAVPVYVIPFKFLPVGAYFHRILPPEDTQEWVIESSRIWSKWATGSAEKFTGRALNGRIMNIGPDAPVRQLFV